MGLLVATALAWFLTFPVIHFIGIGLSGDRSPAALNTPATGPALFFRDYPQLLWLGFILGAAFFFGTRPVKTKSAETDAIDNRELKFTLAGRLVRLPGWLNLAWRLFGLVLLGLILALAAGLRIGDGRDIGAANLVRTDYDEGVHASAALLMAQGKTVYRDFFLTQPPVGPFLWSLPLRISREPWGGLLDFLRLRFFTSILALLTIALVYVTGRRLGGRWAGPLAGAIAAFALAVDGEAVRTDQQVMLEPLVNFMTAAALCAFVHYYPAGNTNKRASLVLLLAAGLFAGLAVSIKIPGLAVGLGLGLTLLVERRWRDSGLYSLGALAGYLGSSGYFFLTSGTAFIKEAYLYQLMRPFNNLALTGNFQAETTLTAFAYTDRTPYLAFTLLASMAGVLAIVLRWTASRGWEGREWLPVTMVAVITLLLFTGKAGFFPHYYAQMALPLALLAGGVVNFWLPGWWKSRLAVPLALVATALAAFSLVPPLQHIGDEPSKPEWSLERALDRSFDYYGIDTETLFSWDARFNFITGTPLATDSYNRYMVDSAAYVEYLALDLSRLSLPEAAGRALFNKPGGDLRQLRYTPVVQDNLLQGSTSAGYVLLEPRAASQLTPQTGQKLAEQLVGIVDTRELSLLANPALISTRSGVLFGSGIRLAGYDSPAEVHLAATGQKLPLKLFWRGEAAIPENYVIFIHLLNSAGETVAQRDNAPRNGELDTGKWKPGQTFQDDMSLDITRKLAPGVYRLEIGVYRPADGKRLPVSNNPPGETLTPGGDSVILGEVRITGP